MQNLKHLRALSIRNLPIRKEAPKGKLSTVLHERLASIVASSIFEDNNHEPKSNLQIIGLGILDVPRHLVRENGAKLLFGAGPNIISVLDSTTSQRRSTSEESASLRSLI